jgi:hypothetical protein
MTTPIKITAPGAHLLASATPGDRVALPEPGAGAQVLVYNDSATLAFVAFGTSDVAASAGTGAPDIPVPPGTLMILTRPAWATHASAITDAGTAALYFAVGEGA